MTNSIHTAIVANAVDKEAERLGKPVSWFRYATKHSKSERYRFLSHKEAQIEILERLALHLKGKLPELTTGQIVDMIADYVNAVYQS